MATPNYSVNMIPQAFLNGQTFNATTGKLTSAGTVLTGFSVFNPANSGKTFFFLAAHGAVATAAPQSQINITTVDPALANAVTPVNSLAGSTTTSVASCTYLNAALTVTGTLYDIAQAGGNNNIEFLPLGNQYIVCPPGTGLLIAIQTSTNAWFASMKWIEF